MPVPNHTTTAGRSTNQLVGYVFGAVYVLVGIVGFFVTSFDGFASREGDLLVVFEVNPLHNIAHLGVGVLLLVGARGGYRAARGMNMFVGLTYLALGVVGFLIEDSSANILALNQADNFLHLASSLVLLGAAFGTDRQMTADRGAAAA